MPTVLAEQFIRKMRGGSQPALLRCSDGLLYLVKFQGNPQTTSVLVNEYLASRLAARIGLPVAEVSIVLVRNSLLLRSPEMYFELPEGRIKMSEGLHLGIRYVIAPSEGSVMDFLAPASLSRVSNITTFAGMLAFDLWTGNTDIRQAVYWKRFDEWTLNACFIDQGYCFGGPRWEFSDHRPGRALYSNKTVYDRIADWIDFEPFLSRIENIRYADIEEIAKQIPTQWYKTWDQLLQLIEKVHRRRTAVRGLLRQCMAATAAAFPGWTTQSPLFSRFTPVNSEGGTERALGMSKPRSRSPKRHVRIGCA